MLKNKREILLVLLFLALAGCQSQVQREKVDVIANNVVADVAQVTQTSLGQKGAPILVIEESHTSRAVRLEEAIVLNRLYYDHKVTQIGLEGSIKERPPIDAEWFSKAAKNQSEATAPVAVNLLREGEINSAEFMELTYSKNIVAVPIETQKEYEVSDDNEASLIYLSYLYQFAMRSPRPEHRAKIANFESEIKKLEGKATAQEAKLEEAQKYIYSLKPSELSDDPWVKSTSDKMLNENDSSISSLDEEIKFYEGIDIRIETTFGKPRPEDAQIMAGFIKFLRAREAANKTMVEAVAVVADKPDVYAVAMIIGAAHTKGIAQMLKAADRPFAVITPKSLNSKQDTTVLSHEMYKRKLQGASVYSGEVTETLLKAFPVSLNRLPPPVMQQKWFNAKSELYLSTERITQKVFASGGGAGVKPPGGGEIPSNLFAGDDFNGEFIRIDPTRIRVVEDVENSGVWAAVFPAEINPNNPALRKTIWVKAGRSGEGVPPLSEKEPVEKMLKDALFEVKNEKLEKDIPLDKSKKQKIDKNKTVENPPDQSKTLPTLEGDGGRIKITRETTAAFADSEAAVMKKSVVARS